MSCDLKVDGATTSAPIGASLFEAAEGVGIRVPTSCNQQGKCRECLMEIERGRDLLSPREPQEEHLGGAFRLSCRARLAAPGQVRAHTMRRGALRIEAGGRALEPAEGERRPRYARKNARLFRDGEPVGSLDAPPLGIALDLGTTTVVLRLEDLESGRRLATHSFENPQRFGGSDVMARIHYDGAHRGRLLQRVLLGYLSRAIDELPGERSSIVEIVVAANTTMRDLLFGLDVSSIGQLPYRSLTENRLHAGEVATTGLDQPAERLRLGLHPAARVHSLPLIGSHVGADAAAGLLATGLADRDEISILMDVGTNTEVLIGNRTRLLAASCPAGPAFEGGGVRCGAPGLEGAIERVRLDPEGPRIEVIGHGPPIGICGSGLVDLLSELLRTRLMNSRGRLVDGSDRFGVAPELDIWLTEADINELAQAKGANAAGLRIVARRFGVELGEIDRFYLAGGFGRHIGLDSAQRIGLIPTLPAERIYQVGNAALEGASRALHSIEARARLDQLVRRIEHVSLESQHDFFDYFVDGCQFEAFGKGGAP